MPAATPTRPISTQLVLPVATYSITMNMPKISTPVPRSCWATMMPSEISHTTITGPSSRIRGQVMPRNLLPTDARLSRVRTR